MSYNPATLTNFYRKCICTDSDDSNNARISDAFGFCPRLHLYKASGQPYNSHHLNQCN